MNMQPFISVIIPAYKEGNRIGRTLLEIKEFFLQKDYEYEILVVLDGSPDNTAEVVENYTAQIPALRMIHNSQNHGKGYVVRQGLMEANGDLRLFMDADGSTSITHLDRFVEEYENGSDVVIGSRDVDGAHVQVHQARYKEILGDMGNWVIRILLGLWRYPDTQCGFKMLTQEAATVIAPLMKVDRFGFDAELLAIAHKYNFVVTQLPVRWLNEEGSSVTLFGPNGYIQVLIDVLKIRWRLWTGGYKIKDTEEE
jgi:glycosyltransferase involved in cell wall biosynthesis